MSLRITIERSSPRLVRAAQKWAGGSPVAIVALEDGGAPDIPVLSFFAGELLGEDGESIALSAYRIASDVAFLTADRVLEESSTLARINRDMGRGTLRLYLAKRMAEPLRQMLVRVAVADRMDPEGRILLNRPGHLPVEGLVPGIPRERVRLVGSRTGLGERVSGLREVLAATWRGMGRSHRTAARRSTGAIRVLMPHEDTLGTDRSLRRQPHWLEPDDCMGEFEALIYPVSSDLGSEAADTALGKASVIPLTRARVRGYRKAQRAGPVMERLSSWKRETLRVALMGSSSHERWASGVAYRLVDVCQSVAATVAAESVDIMLTSDPHLIQADAMAVVAELTGRPLAAYQYSNLATHSVAMLTTADCFLLFHQAFRPLWDESGVTPGRFEAIGYSFDGAFHACSHRGRMHRERLQANGADFVICLFDESVQEDKFGVIAVQDHHQELLALLGYMLAEPGIGVVVKSQFQSNTPSRRYPDDPTVKAALSTGRFLELTTGDHRNLVYPAEAALISDIAIGNIVGATASLEAALAGRRSLLLDQHGQKRHRRELYDQADLVYPSMKEAIAAIRRHRSGDPAAAALGDWTPIIDQFDAFRDGRSAERLRSSLIDLIQREKT